MVPLSRTNVLDSAYFDFTPDEKNLYLCTSAGLSSGSGGSVYSVPGFKSVYSIDSDPRSKDFLSVDCSYDQAANAILFELSDYQPENPPGDELPPYENKTLTLKYNISTGIVE